MQTHLMCKNIHTGRHPRGVRKTSMSTLNFISWWKNETNGLTEAWQRAGMCWTSKVMEEQCGAGFLEYSIKRWSAMHLLKTLITALFFRVFIQYSVWLKGKKRKICSQLQRGLCWHFLYFFKINNTSWSSSADEFCWLKISECTLLTLATWGPFIRCAGISIISHHRSEHIGNTTAANKLTSIEFTEHQQPFSHIVICVMKIQD